MASDPTHTSGGRRRGNSKLVYDKATQAVLAIGVHDWFVPEFIGYECCRKCGIVRRADDKNKPCRGKVVLSLRDEYTEGDHAK